MFARFLARTHRTTTVKIHRPFCLPAAGRRTALSIIAFIVMMGVAVACNIPVFRYALERWQPDACEMIVFYDSELSPAQRQVIKPFESASADNDGDSNLKVVFVPVGALSDATGPSELGADSLNELRAVHQSLKPTVSPYVVLRSKIGGRRAANHWHGKLEEVGALNLLRSPARNELSRRLMAGHSVVWLMLKCKDDARNKEVREMMNANLESLTGKIVMPEGVGLPGSELHSEVPLLIRFSLLEIDATDKKEKYLIDLFSGFCPEAVEQGEPLLVPVFGRGRALEVIPSGDLDSRLTEGLTQFLSGACSCQVKNQNPGFDLLITADWDTELFGEDGVRPPPAKTVGDRATTPQLLTIPPGRKR